MTVVDWRGVEIKEGDILVYGAGVGRSVALVEATFTGRLTPSGRLWVRIVRRAYGGGADTAAQEVHIGADRVTVTGVLPASTLPHEDDVVRKAVAKSIAYHRRALVDGWEGRQSVYEWTTKEWTEYHEAELAKLAKKLKELG